MTQTSSNIQGLGDNQAVLNVYIANRPFFTFNDSNTEPNSNSNSNSNCTSNKHVAALHKGEIKACGHACGNGWRKVFNVYAKLVYAMAMPLFQVSKYSCWQDYRDNLLLQKGSGTSLIFSHPKEVDINKNDTALLYIPASFVPAIHIVMGKTYAKALDVTKDSIWLDNEFAIHREKRLIVCPYFDYRQLSNIKIIRLVELIKQFDLPFSH